MTKRCLITCAVIVSACSVSIAQRPNILLIITEQNYADVMSGFAAGERYINRVWSASTDGYEDEVHLYLEKARMQFAEASGLFNQLESESTMKAASNSSGNTT